MARRRKMRYPVLSKWMMDNCVTYQMLSDSTGIPYHELWGKLNFQRNIGSDDIDTICKATNLSKRKLLEGEIII